jgi:hypothetical protein
MNACLRKLVETFPRLDVSLIWSRSFFEANEDKSDTWYIEAKEERRTWKLEDSKESWSGIPPLALLSCIPFQ